MVKPSSILKSFPGSLERIESGSVSFVDVAATAGVVDGGRAITTGWADFNNDGHLRERIPRF